MNQLPSTINLKNSIEQFHARSLWGEEVTNSNLEQLAETISLIKDEIEQIGSEANEHIEEKIAEKGDYFVTYQWVEQAKSFLILWRDVLFQQHKAEILHADDNIELDALDNLRKQSENTLNEAQAAFKQFAEDGLRKLDDKQIEKWKHQKSPWNIYHEQIKEIEGQSTLLLEQNQLLKNSVRYFTTLHNIIHNLVKECNNEVVSIKNKASETDIFITTSLENKTETTFNKIINSLEELEKKYTIKHHLKTFLNRWEIEKLALPKRQAYVVGINEGMLQQKDLDLDKSVRQWIDAEILPLLYEAWELLERIEHEFKVSLANIRNRTILLSKEEANTTDDLASLSLPLESFLKKTERNESLLQELSNKVMSKLDNEFILSNIFYPTKAFLVVPFQNTVSQIKFNQSSFLNRSYNWWNKQINRLKTIRKTVEQGETLSISERIVRLIQHRKKALDNLQYASIFQTEGYIGESFFVGREDEMERIARLIEQWNDGFRGTLLFTGQRFSGKTLMGEYTKNRHFSSNCIELSPNSNIEVQGRKLTTSYDLGEALNFVQKYSLNQRPMVWIDDLELWQSPQVPLGKNIRYLFNYLDRYSTRIFFVTTMSNWLKEHLSKHYEINKLFQATINLDHMSMQEIGDAIMIRHGATHKTLINDKNNEVLTPQFQRLRERVGRSAEGNIGEALLRWSYSIHPIEGKEQVRFERSQHQLPDFLTPDISILLSTILMQKKTSEYRLRKLFGTPFNEKYNDILQRLLNIGIIQRDLSGNLEINKLIVNDLGRLLEKNSYITFKV